MPDATEEGRHAPGRGRRWEESYSFDFATRDGSWGGYVRLGLRPADGVAWYWAAFVSDGEGGHPALVLVRDHDVPVPRGPSLEVRTSGLWADHTCETAHEHWTVGVEAFGVALDDPREAFAGERGDRCPLGLDLEWEATGGARGGGVAAGDGDGYEQSCTVHGEVLVGAERLELDGVGWRAHLWGDRDWWPADPWVAATGHLDDDVAFTLADGAIDVGTDDGLVVSATIGALGLTGTPVAHAPVAVPGTGGRVSRLDRALCRYRGADGRTGVGWVERLTPP